MVTKSPETDTDRIGKTSITTPRVEERPAKQWPPARVAEARPCRRTKVSVSRTSSGVAHRTTAIGTTSWYRALKVRGSSSYAVEPGRMTYASHSGARRWGFDG